MVNVLQFCCFLRTLISHISVLVFCSALAVLASSSGVSGERHAFMQLVKNEIERLNTQMNSKGSLSMVFRSGGVTVRCLDPPYRSITLLRLPMHLSCHALLTMHCSEDGVASDRDSWAAMRSMNDAF